MLSKRLNIMLFIFTLIPFFCHGVILANNEEKDKISITLFRVHDDFAQCDTFAAKQPIIFYILWNIPNGVILKGEAILRVEGEETNGGKWIIEGKKELIPECPSHYWGWDCHKIIPKKARPGSIATAVIELNIEGHEPIQKSLTFNIKNG